MSASVGAVEAALGDYDAACKTALDLIRRDRYARAEWALVRAGRKVAMAVGCVFDDHPLGDLVYLEPFKITHADIAREKRARELAVAS